MSPEMVERSSRCRLLETKADYRHLIRLLGVLPTGAWHLLALLSLPPRATEKPLPHGRKGLVSSINSQSAIDPQPILGADTRHRAGSSAQGSQPLPVNGPPKTVGADATGTDSTAPVRQEIPSVPTFDVETSSRSGGSSISWKS